MPPRLTSSLPGVGGLLKVVPEDFVVEELPLYLPSGEGEHTFLFIEKRGMTTEEALVLLCRATGLPRDAAGAAGMKDRQAVTRQWVSLPALDPAAALTLSVPGLRVLSAARHGNKLRTGHLRGNRFHLVLRGLRLPVEEALARARAIFDVLTDQGLPNRYGPQRFGARGDNAARGRALLVEGEERRDGRRLGRGERRLLVSALQAELFNRYLDARMEDGLLHTVLVGDIVRRRDSGGLFSVEPALLEETQRRLDARELDISGPMFGHKMLPPVEGSPAAAREDAILHPAGLTRAQFQAAAALAEGTRRPLTVPVTDVQLQPGEDAGTLQVRFSLPSGAYATVLIDELAKGESRSNNE